MADFTITLQNIVSLALTHAELYPLTGVSGLTNEPALSLCRETLQELLAAPLDWKFNRAEMNMMVTSTNRQDYLFAGAVLFSIAASQSAGIDLTSNNALTISGSTVTILTLEQYNGKVGDVCYIRGSSGGTNYDSTLVQNGTTSSFSGNIYTITAINGLTVTATVSGGTLPTGTSGSAGITDLAWLVEGTMWGLFSNQPIFPTKHLEVVRALQLEGSVKTPEKVCIVSDLNTGVLKIRFWRVPGTVIWGVNLVYQKKPPLAADLTGSWSPFPDAYSYVYRQAFLAKAYRYVKSPSADVEEQKKDKAILKALGAGDREMSDRHLYPEDGIMTALDNWWVI